MILFGVQHQRYSCLTQFWRHTVLPLTASFGLPCIAISSIGNLLVFCVIPFWETQVLPTVKPPLWLCRSCCAVRPVNVLCFVQYVAVGYDCVLSVSSQPPLVAVPPNFALMVAQVMVKFGLYPPSLGATSLNRYGFVLSGWFLSCYRCRVCWHRYNHR